MGTAKRSNGGGARAAASRPRLLVLVVACQAESTLVRVLDRIPRSVFDDYECEVLVIDDGSHDRTLDVGQEYRRARPQWPLVVLRNQVTQGYGGSQKVGFAYAIRKGFELIAVLHGDGKFAPEELPRLVAPVAKGVADAAVGSRMPADSTRPRVMPFYKFVGNRVLTRFQNVALGTHLSDFHSGYRVYSVGALSGIPFELNTDDFHFDTEVLIQLLQSERRIVELPVPPYHGEDLSHARGVRYAGRVARVTLQAVAHRFGVLYQRRYDTGPHDLSHYDLKLGYPSSHTYAIAAVPEGARVVDLGAGPGGVATELVRKNCEVTAVDRVSGAASDSNVRRVVQDLNAPLEIDIRPFDHILMLDIIEHLQDPERFLQDLRAQFDFETRRLILTTPNVAFFVQRGMLLLGQMNYGKAGVLDRTHTRLFTFASMRRLLRDAGYRNVRMKCVSAPFPKVLGDGPLGRLAVDVNRALIRIAPTLFSYQIFVEAETTPAVEFVLETAQRFEREQRRAAARASKPDDPS